MIKKMKKLEFLVLENEYECFLEDLRKLGVVHVTEKEGFADDNLKSDYSTLAEYTKLLSDLQSITINKDNVGLPSDAPLDDYAALKSEKERLEKRLAELHASELKAEPWGDVDSELVLKLDEAGCKIHAYYCQAKHFKYFTDSYEISRTSDKVFFVTIEDSIDDDRLVECKLPEEKLSDIRSELSLTKNKLSDVLNAICAFASANIKPLENKINELKNKLDFSRVRASADSFCENKIKYLSGWIPADLRTAVEEKMNEGSYYYEISDPEPDDDIPIILSNNSFFRLFEPLTKLYMLPKSGELDLTPFFAPFFMLFFGLCLGDMGYGLLIILALPVFLKLFQLINPDFSKGLVLLFGASTMLCGTLSGTFFGFNIYDLDITFIQKMKSLLYTDNSAMFTLSLEIGVVQILFGMVLKAINKAIQFGFKYAVSTIGWFILIITIIVAFIFKIDFSNPIVIGLLILSAAAIFLYNSPGKNPFLNIGLGLWDTYNMATGLLGDVLSYVRLFALGLSGGILASVFNSMAEGMSPDIPVLGFLVTVLIFLVGHALNVFMSILGAVVHPMRLTFVEFFKNAGYEGGGTAYNPFQLK